MNPESMKHLQLRLRLFVLLAVLLSAFSAQAGTKTWTGAAGTAWATAGSWNPSGIPSTTTDTVYFRSGSVNCVLPSTALIVLRMYIDGTYTGVVSKPSGDLTINAATRGLVVSSGTLALGAGNVSISAASFITGGIVTCSTGAVTFTGAFSQSGGTFTCNAGTVTHSSTFTLTGGTYNGHTTAHTLMLTGAFVQSGGTLNLNSANVTARSNVTFNNTALTFNAGSSSFILTSTSTLSVSNEPLIQFNKLEFKPTATATFTITSSGTTTIRVADELKLSGSVAFSLTGDTLNALGNVVSANTVGIITATTIIHFIGTANQLLTGSGTAGLGNFGDLVFNKPSGIVSLNSIISVRGNWTLISGTIAPGASTVFFIGTTAKTIDMLNASSVLMPFFGFGVNAGTVTLATNLVVTGPLGIGTLANAAVLNANNKDIKAGGDWTNLGGTFTPGTGTVTFNGTGFNIITKATTGETFTNVVFNRNSGSVNLPTPMTITGALTLTKGRIKALGTNFLGFGTAATYTGGGTGAYVHGKVRKTGTTAFTFPLGDTTLVDSVAWHPLTITAPATSDVFEAEYRPIAQTAGTALDANLNSVSVTEHWFLRRISGASAVTATLNWSVNSGVNSLGDLRLAAWSGTQWSDLGQSVLTVNWPRGSVRATSTTLFVSNVATLTTAVSKTTPAYAGLTQVLDGSYYTVVNRSLFFQLQDDYNDPGTTVAYRVLNATNVNVAPTLVTTTNNTPITKYGPNLFRLDLYTTSGPLATGFYILEVTTQKNETFYLRFSMP